MSAIQRASVMNADRQGVRRRGQHAIAGGRLEEAVLEALDEVRVAVGRIAKSP